MPAAQDVLTGQEQQVNKRSVFMEKKKLAGKTCNKKKVEMEESFHKRYKTSLSFTWFS